MNLDFGVFLSPENVSYETLRSRATRCKELGFHSIWLSDHLFGIQSPASSRLECWTTLTALASVTEKVRYGQLTLAAPFRNPALLAKMAATLDVITEGRAILSIGAGWHEGEFQGYGYHYGSGRSRVERLEEAAQIIKLLWMEESPTFQGRHYSIKDSYCNPKPVQKPHPPLMIAGGGEKLTLKTVARHADMSNFATWVGTPHTFGAKVRILNRHCVKVGRNPEEIRKTWAAFIFIDEKQEEAERKATDFFSTVFSDRGSTPSQGLVGTPENIISQIQCFIEEGATLFILRFLGGEWAEEATLFRDQVMSVFK